MTPPLPTPAESRALAAAGFVATRPGYWRDGFGHGREVTTAQALRMAAGDARRRDAA